MVIESLWPTYLLSSTATGLEAERNYILEKLKQLQDTGVPNSADKLENTTVNGYQPSYNFLQDVKCQSLFEKLLDPISNKYWKLFSAQGDNVPTSVKFNYKAWVVKYYPGAYQNLHMHKNSIISGIWYLDVDEQEDGAGEFHLQNPNIASFTLGFFNQVKKIAPKTDDIIVFPSWAQHCATPTTATRIAFVWDCVVSPL
jgi:hypothetical protein